MNENAPSPLLVPLSAAARSLSVSPRTVQYLVAAGRLQRLKIGSRTLFAVSELERFVASLRPGPEEIADTIPHLALGGIVSAPTLALIGEGREPEAVAPLSELKALIAAAVAKRPDDEPPDGAMVPA